MSGKAAKIVLTEMQLHELTKIRRSTVCPQRIVVRATIIWLAFEGMLNSEISSVVGIGRQQVGLWRRRWQQSFDALLQVEQNETHAEFRRTIEDVLSIEPICQSNDPSPTTLYRVRLAPSLNETQLTPDETTLMLWIPTSASNNGTNSDVPICSSIPPLHTSQGLRVLCLMRVASTAALLVCVLVTCCATKLSK